MGKGAPIHPLRAWRNARGLSLQDAASKLIVDGEPCHKSSWYAWEHGTVPKPEWLISLCGLTGLEPNDFYPWPRKATGNVVRGNGDGQGGGSSGAPAAKGGNGEPPQMALAL